jgi:hypothetical protein
MQDLDKIRRITINFSALQGLKIIPLGLLLIAVSLWTNSRSGPRRDLLFPGGCIVAAYFLYWLVTRYYDRTYGTIQPTPAQRRSEIVWSILGGVVGLLAFLLDISYRLPVSFVGLLLAACIPLENLRLTWQIGIRVEPLKIISAGFLAVFSLVLPIAEINWWEIFGIRAMMLGVLILTGLVFIVIGIWEHSRLARWLPIPREANHGQRI